MYNADIMSEEERQRIAIARDEQASEQRAIDAENYVSPEEDAAEEKAKYEASLTEAVDDVCAMVGDAYSRQDVETKIRALRSLDVYNLPPGTTDTAIFKNANGDTIAKVCIDSNETAFYVDDVI